MTKEEFIAWHGQNPNATATDAARNFGVSRQRIHQICAATGVSLKKYRLTPGAYQRRSAPKPENTFLGSYLERSGRHAETRAGSNRSGGAVAECHVAADLMANNAYVFWPMLPYSKCDLVAIIDEKCFRVEVKANKAQVSSERRANGHFDVLARVNKDGQIFYKPEDGVEWPVKDRLKGA